MSEERVDQITVTLQATMELHYEDMTVAMARTLAAGDVDFYRPDWEIIKIEEVTYVR